MMDDRQLDVLLARDRTSEANPVLRARIIAAAPPLRTRRLGWLAAAGLGVGLATSAVAGVAAGVKLAPPAVVRLVSNELAPDANEPATSLSDPFDDAGV
jgi:hypothetical protein